MAGFKNAVNLRWRDAKGRAMISRPNNSVDRLRGSIAIDLRDKFVSIPLIAFPGDPSLADEADLIAEDGRFAVFGGGNGVVEADLGVLVVVAEEEDVSCVIIGGS